MFAPVNEPPVDELTSAATPDFTPEDHSGEQVEDESGELDYEEFVRMLLRLKKERMLMIGCCTKLARWRKRKWDYCCRPRIGKKKVKSLQNASGKRMGAWSKYIHPVIGKAYYYNSTTGAHYD